jgi:hypothetical protein
VANCHLFTAHTTFRHIFGGSAKPRKATIGFIMNVRPSARPPAFSNSAPTGRIVMKFEISVFFENLSRKFKFDLNLRRITATLHEDAHMCTFMIIYMAYLFFEYVSDKRCGENQNTHLAFNNVFSLQIVPFMG